MRVRWLDALAGDAEKASVAASVMPRIQIEIVGSSRIVNSW
jgi:hypothetical protein